MRVRTVLLILAAGAALIGALEEPAHSQENPLGLTPAEQIVLGGVVMSMAPKYCGVEFRSERDVRDLEIAVTIAKTSVGDVRAAQIAALAILGMEIGAAPDVCDTLLKGPASKYFIPR